MEVQTDPELRKYLKRLTLFNRTDQVILRGCITGMFTAIGVLLGTAIIFFIGTQLLSGLKEIPIIDSILEQTRLDVLIENEVRRLRGDTEPGEDTTPDTEATVEVKYLTYQDTDLGISFEYPDYLTSLYKDEVNSKLQLTGDSGILISLDVFTDEFTLTGDSSQRFIPRSDMERIVVNMYEGGAVYNGGTVTNAVYSATITKDEQTINFVAIAAADAPKLGREVFTLILESLVLED
jgi:hypothetical protein